MCKFCDKPTTLKYLKGKVHGRNLTCGSRECYLKSFTKRERVIKACISCNKEFDVLKCAEKRTKRCRECYEIYRKKLTSNKQMRANCKHCGKEFRTFPYEIKIGKGKYCSKECYKSSFGEWIKKECPVCKKEFVVKPSYKYVSCCSRQCMVRNRNETSIEKAVYDYLVIKGIVFERQKQVGNRFVVDAYIPSLNLVIEADGVYWHGLEKGIKIDKKKNKYLKSKGYNLIRLSEEKIRNGKFKELLKGGGV